MKARSGADALACNVWRTNTSIAAAAGGWRQWRTEVVDGGEAMCTPPRKKIYMIQTSMRCVRDVVYLKLT
jgi:hypothetical protein